MEDLQRRVNLHLRRVRESHDEDVEKPPEIKFQRTDLDYAHHQGRKKGGKAQPRDTIVTFLLYFKKM